MGAAPIFQALAVSSGGGGGPLDPELAAIAGLESRADTVAYFTGSATATLADYTSFARAWDALPGIPEAGAYLGLGTAAFAATGISGHTLPFLDAAINTFAGNATFTGALVTSELNVDSAPSTIAAVYYRTNGVDKWAAGKTNNTADDFTLTAYNDVGSPVSAFTITRADSIVRFALAPTAPTSPLHDSSVNLATTKFVVDEIATYPWTVASIPGLQGALDAKQNVDQTLTALAGLDSSLGLVEQYGVDTFRKRIIGGSALSSIPTFQDGDNRWALKVHTHNIADVTNLQTTLNAKQDFDATLAGLAILIGSAGLVEQTSANIFAVRDIGTANPTSILTRADGDARYTAGTVHTHPISDIVGLQTALDGKQSFDNTLSALALLDSSVGVVEQTGVDTFVKRPIGVGFGTSLLTRADGDLRYATAAHTHVMANITDLAAALALKQTADLTLTGLAALDTVVGLVEQTGTDVFTKRTIGVGTGNAIPTTALADARYATTSALATKQGLDLTLTGLTSLPGTPGVIEQTTLDTFVIRSIGTSPSTALLTVGDADARFQSVALDPTLVALAALDSVAGLVEQTAADTFTKRLIGVTNASDVLTRSLADTRYATAASVTNLQPLDTTLTGLALLDTTTGMVEQTGATAFAKRALGVGAGTSILTRADGDTRYVSSVTLDNLQPLDSTLTGLAALTPGAGLVEQTTTDTFVMRLIGVGGATSILTRADGDGRYATVVHTHLASDISNLQSLLDARQLADPTLSGLALLDSVLGLVEQTGTDQFAKRLIGVTNPTDIPTRALADTRYAAFTHTHAIADVSNLQTTLNAKQASDPTLSGLAALPATLGLVTQSTAADTFTITLIGVTNASDIPTRALADARYAAFTHTHTTAQVTGLDTALAGKQPSDLTLTGLAALAGANGLVEQTALNTFQTRLIGTTAGTSIPSLADADARYAATNHTQSIATVTNLQTTLDGKQPIDTTLSGLAGLDAIAGLVEQTAADVFTKRLIGVSASTSILTRADGDTRYADSLHVHTITDITNLQTTLDAKQPGDTTLTALATLNATSGLLEQTAPDVFAKRLIGIGTSASVPTLADTDARYAILAHTHAIADVINLQAVLDSKQTSDPTLIALAGLSVTVGLVEQTGPDAFTKRAIGVANATDIPTRADGDTRWGAGLIAHTHPISDVTGLQTALDGKQPIDLTLTALAGLTAAVGLLEQTGLDTFAKRAIGTGTSASLPTLADTDARYATLVHTHAIADVTSLQTSLNAKQNQDATLDALALLNATAGLLEQTAGDTFTKRLIGVTNASDIPTRALADARYATAIHIHAIADVTNLQTTLNAKQTQDATLDALALLNATAGLLEQTGTDTFTKRLIGVTNTTDIPTRANGDARWAQLAGAAFTGAVSFAVSPTSLTPTAGDSTTKVATTAFVTAAIAGATTGGVPAGGTTNQILTKLSNANYDMGWVNPAGVGTFLALTGGTMTGPLALASNPIGLLDAAPKQYVDAGLLLKANLASPVFTGNPTTPNITYPNDTLSVANTAFVTDAIATTQPLDGTLTALATLDAVSGLVEQTAVDTFTKRLIGVTNTSDIPTRALADARYATLVHTHPVSDITSLQTFLDGKQPVDLTLTALAGLNATAGLVEQTGADAFTKRAIGIGAGTSIPTFTDTEGRYATITHTQAISSVTGLQTALDAKQAADLTLTGLSTLDTVLGLVEQTGVDTFAKRRIGTVNPTDILTRADGDSRYSTAAGQPLDNTLTALAGLNATAGLVEQTGADTFTKRLIGIGAGTSIPTFTDTEGRYATITHTHTTAQVIGLDTALTGKQAADLTLTALAGLNTTAGLVEQTGADAFTKRLIGVANTTDILTRALSDARYAPIIHVHPISDVTNLQTSLNAKQNQDATLDALALLTTTLGLVEQTGVDQFNKRLIGTAQSTSIPTLGDADARYAGIIHGHAIADITSLQTTLNAKQPQDNTLTGLAAMPGTLGLVTQSTAADTFSITLIGAANDTDILTRVLGDARWGTLQAHTHPISDVIGLSAALAAKQDFDDTLDGLAALPDGAGVVTQSVTPDNFAITPTGTAFSTSILTRADGDGRYATIVHTHVMANITDLAAALANLQPKEATLTALSIIPATVGLVKQTGTDVFGIVLTGTAAGTSIPTYADTEARYSIIGHTHTTAQITNLDTQLANKQPLDTTLNALAALTNTTLGLLEQVTGTDQFVKRAIGTAAGTSIPTWADTEARYLTTASITGKQDADLTLTGLAALPATVGLVKQTGTDVFGIVLTGTAAGTSIPTWADTEARYSLLGHTHVMANITDLAAAMALKQTADLTLTGLAAMPATAGLVTQGPADTFTITVIGVAAGSQIPNTTLADGRYATLVHTHTTAQVIGLDTALGNLQPKDTTLTGLALLDAATGLVEQTGTDVFAKHAMGLANAGDVLRRSDGDIRYAQLAGAAFTGAVTTASTLTVTSNLVTSGQFKIDQVGDATAAQVLMDVDNNQVAFIYLRTGTAYRWIFGKNNTLETGTGDAGSDFAVSAYNDAGSAFPVLSINRASQITNFTFPPTVVTLNAATWPSTTNQLVTAKFVTDAVGSITGSYQPLDPQLTALASPTPNAAAADRVPFYTSATASDTAAFTSTGRSLVGAASIAAVQTLLTLGTAAYAATGTSAHTLPYLDGVNTWGPGAQTISTTIASSVMLEVVTSAPTAGSWISIYKSGIHTAGQLFNIGELRWYAGNDAGTKASYLRIAGQMADSAAASGDAYFQFFGASNTAGATANFGTIGAGWQVGGPTGGDMGTGSINVKGGIYENGIAISTKYAALAGADFTGPVDVAGALTTAAITATSNITTTGGYLMADSNTSNAYLYIDGNSGFNALIWFRTLGVTKFYMGSNTLDNFVLVGYDDAAVGHTILSVVRDVDPVVNFGWNPTTSNAQTYPDGVSGSSQLATTAFVMAAITASSKEIYTYTNAAPGAQTVAMGAYVWEVTAGTFNAGATVTLTGSGAPAGVSLTKIDVYPNIVYITGADTAVSIALFGTISGLVTTLRRI